MLCCGNFSVLKKLGMEQVGRHYYDSQAKFTVNCDNMKFELWPGIITSILQYEKDSIMMCTEISHKVWLYVWVVGVNL